MAHSKTTSFCIYLAVLLIANTVSCLNIVTREEWGAKLPKGRTIIPNKLTHVIIHHTYIPEACLTSSKCVLAMKWMQDFHQNDRKWDDIGYSFAIGGDGKIYEGRGFNVVGAHAPGYNDKSLGITLIGDWTKTIPPTQMLEATNELINYAIARGSLNCDYILHGHSQVRATECPGAALFNEIKKWPHFAEVKNKTFS